ncbi:MAG TPA: futalosine hydrolase [Flavipsychrobacter sp.]
MKILVIAATEAEIALSIKHIASIATEVKPLVFEHNGHVIIFSFIGVGIVATTYNLAKMLADETYDLVIQAGIAGAFDRNIALGDMFLVRSDRLADMGAEDGNSFVDIFDLNLTNADEPPFTNKLLINPYSAAELGIQLKEADAITTNTVTGSHDSVKRLQKQYPTALESMEGAAFHYVCLCEGVMFAQVRTVSNYIERRNRGSWQIEPALKTLNGFLIDLLIEKTNVPAKKP